MTIILSLQNSVPWDAPSALCSGLQNTHLHAKDDTFKPANTDILFLQKIRWILVYNMFCLQSDITLAPVPWTTLTITSNKINVNIKNNLYSIFTAWKVPNTELFLVLIFPYWSEYGDLGRKSPYSARIRENTDQKKLLIRALFTQWLFCLEKRFLKLQ